MFFKSQEFTSPKINFLQTPYFFTRWDFKKLYVAIVHSFLCNRLQGCTPITPNHFMPNTHYTENTFSRYAESHYTGYSFILN